MRKVGLLQRIKTASGGSESEDRTHRLARYSVPTRYVGVPVEVRAESGQVVIEHDGREVACHPLMAPGEASVLDEHYARGVRRPARPVRVRTATEVGFLSLGPVAEAFLRAAAAAGTPRLAAELAEMVTMEASWGRPALVAALERATRFRRFKADDLRAILAAGHRTPEPVAPGEGLRLELPQVPVRPLSAYAIEMVR